MKSIIFQMKFSNPDVPSIKIELDDSQEDEAVTLCKCASARSGLHGIVDWVSVVADGNEIARYNILMPALSRGRRRKA